MPRGFTMTGVYNGEGRRTTRGVQRQGAYDAKGRTTVKG